MNWILVASLAWLQTAPMVYPNKEICHEALAEVRKIDFRAICIPQGTDYARSGRIDEMREFFTLFGERVDTLRGNTNGH